MNTTMMNVRTVSLVKELSTEMRHGANGDFESKTIMFRIATDRNYRISKTENGKTTMEYPTDFYLAKATGKVAESLAQYCTAKKEDGKLVSRHLLVSGSFETYQKDVTEHVTLTNVNINGVLYNVEGDVVLPNRTQYIFVIDSFSFLDKNPAPQTPSASAAPMAAPAAAPVQAAPVQATAPVQYQQSAPAYAQQGAPMGQAPAAPVAPMPAAPVATAPTAATYAAAPQGAPVAPPAPTVGQNFVNSSGTAPF